MRAPFGAGPRFPLRQASEEIFRPTGMQTSVVQSISSTHFPVRQTEGQADSCPSPTSTNAVFVLTPEPPVYTGHRGAKREQVLPCLVELLLQGPFTYVAGVLTFFGKAASPKLSSYPSGLTWGHLRSQRKDSSVLHD